VILRRLISAVFIMTAGLAAMEARSDVIVSLEATGVGGEPVFGPVPAGSELVIRVLLSVDGADVPLPDVRSLQFDFGSTAPALDLADFAWDVDPALYGFMTAGLPTPAATSLLQTGGIGLIELSETPLQVASVTVTVNDSGILDAVGSSTGTGTSLAEFDAGFPFVAYTLGNGNLAGGTLLLSVTGAIDPDGDADGDGVPNADDAFPYDPSETTDSDGDGVGDNGDAFPNDPDETADTDGDGVGDNGDAFPTDPDETTDTDGDGVGDNGDAFPTDPDETADTDADGVGDNGDAFPTDPDETADTDGDGVGDNGDAFPTDPGETADSDGDGIGDNADDDSDTDGTGRTGFCGVAMVQTSVLLLCGLSAMKFGRRRRLGEVTAQDTPSRYAGRIERKGDTSRRLNRSGSRDPDRPRASRP
jgi:hypothetical protein